MAPRARLPPPRLPRRLLGAGARPPARLAAGLALAPPARLRDLLPRPLSPAGACLLSRGRFALRTILAGHSHLGPRAHELAAVTAAAVHHSCHADLHVPASGA